MTKAKAPRGEAMTADVRPSALTAQRRASFRTPVRCGVFFGIVQVATPVAFRWLTPSAVYALSLTLIAAVYIGFAVADARPKVIAVESAVAGAFVVLAAVGFTGSPWLLVLGYAAHGAKDAWQEHSRYVANTRWWPPFCATVDWLVALILTLEIVAGAAFPR